MIRKQLKTALSAIALGLAASTAAQAGVIDFEDVDPMLFSGSSITSGGVDFASAGTAGFSGVDNAGAFSIFANAPDNSSGQFLFSLNDDSVTVTLGGQRFLGLDAAFVAPFGFAPSTIAGRLLVAAQTADGLIQADYDFGGAGASGNWSFFTINTDALASSSVSSITFSACVYDGAGGCVRDAFLSQFAIDNLRVPEPASALAALGLLAATRRRQSV
jgi:hypothetical protein